MDLSRSIDDVKDDLKKVISRANIIISGLETHEPFQMVLQDFIEQRKLIDENWHLITDDKKLQEARITKMAANAVVDILSHYKHDLEYATAELIKIENPDVLVNKQYDPE